MKNTQKFLEKLWPFDFLAYFANALIHKYLRQNNYIWTLFYFQLPYPTLLFLFISIFLSHNHLSLISLLSLSRSRCIGEHIDVQITFSRKLLETIDV